MEDCDIEGNISSPFLKHLSIVASFFQTDPVRARISLPGLVSLELTGVLRRTPVLESMPLLVSAIVRLELDCHDNCNKNDYGDCGNRRCWNCHDPRTGADDWRGKSVLLKGLSEVAELELSVESQVVCLLAPTLALFFYPFKTDSVSGSLLVYRLQWNLSYLIPYPFSVITSYTTELQQINDFVPLDSSLSTGI
jgi:hypothetical protein